MDPNRRSVTPLPDPERWHRIAPILEEALGMPPEQRAAFLDRVCGGDSVLRAEIESLLIADQKAGSFLETPVDLSSVAPAGEDAFDSVAGRTIGAYRLVREIGRGGMGVVYEAEQRQPRRAVALKVILGGRHVGAETVRMFQRESQSLARLKHPSIAAVYESGSTPEGEHFFAMELVQGRSLSDVLQEGGVPASRQDVRARLAVFRNICAAVAYAHQRGVIHRDLKPSNIVVLAPSSESVSSASGRRGADAAPDIKVLDFGLARITDADADDATAVTALGRIQGTLPYMSPEQVRGRRDEVDVRTDVYSLGVILYRMLTGCLPYDLERAQFPDAARIICDEPPRPISKASGDRSPIDHDLAVIVFKALEKDPARRYQGVPALDEDIARYLAGQPILARPPSAAYLIRKLVARHKVPFAAAGALIVMLAAFAVVSSLQARRIAQERDRANREARTALKVSDFMTDLFKVSDPYAAKGETVTAREILDRGIEKIERELADEPEVQARLLSTMGAVYSNLGLFGKAGPLLERSLTTQRRLLGDGSPETLSTMYNLAFQYAQVGRTAEAQTLHEQVVEIRRRLLGEDDPATLLAMSGLAEDFRRQGRYAEGEDLARRVLEGRRRALGEDDALTLASMGNLANFYYMQKRYPEAEALYRSTVERCRRALGHNHPTTIINISNLASAYKRQGRFDDAETLLRDSVDDVRRVMGEDHPLTLTARHHLAELYWAEGRLSDAERLYRDILDRRRRLLGEDHYDTLDTKDSLAGVLSAEGHGADAEALLQEVLEERRRVLGENHPRILDTLYNLACVTARRGDSAAAFGWLRRAVAQGYSQPDTMAKDPDLAPLRGAPAFQEIVDGARRNAENARHAPATAGTSPGAPASPAGSGR